MKRKTRLGVALALGSAAAAATASAAEFDLIGGASATAGVRWAPAFFAEVAAASSDSHAHFEPLGSVGAIGSRNTDHENLDHTVFLIAGGLRYGREDGLFVSAQIAAISTRTDALSGRFEFMTSLGWRDGRWMVMLRHVSDAHILGGGPNLGETMLLAGVRI